MRILVVDDQPEVRRVLRRFLEKKISNVEILEAADGQEALTTSAKHPPDAILLDISMPGSSGIHVIRSLTKQAPDTKILVISSHFGMGEEMQAMGAHAFFPKTTSPKTILKALKELLPA